MDKWHAPDATPPLRAAPELDAAPEAVPDIDVLEAEAEVAPAPIAPPEIQRADPPDVPAPLKVGPFSEEERRIVEGMLEQDQTCAEIAAHLNRSGQAVGAIKAKIRKASRQRKDTPAPSDHIDCVQVGPIKFDDEPSPAPTGAPEPEAAPEPQPEPKAAPVPRPERSFRSHIVLLEHFSGHAKDINAHLNALGYQDVWDPYRDALLVDLICAGFSKTLGTKSLLGAVVSRNECLDRWKSLNTNIGSLDHQAVLIRVLSCRATEGQARS